MMSANNAAETDIGLSAVQVKKLNEFINSRLGLFFNDNRLSDLERGFEAASRDFGFAGPQACLNWLLSSDVSRSEIEILASHLTIGESYFMRDHTVIEGLEKTVLPKIIRKRAAKKSLRIWSAGCSTGEEPYSVAILLSKLIPDINEWNINIQATDINPNFLVKAATGIYNHWSLRGTPDWLKSIYFKPLSDGRLRLNENIRKMVKFTYHNLAQDPFPSLANNTNAMDVILCRNVLMYFVRDQVEQILERFSRSLIDDGWFIVGPNETRLAAVGNFSSVSLPDTFCFFQKKATAVPSQAAEATLSMAKEEPRKKPASETKPLSPEAPLFERALDLYRGGQYAAVIETVADIAKNGTADDQALLLLARSYACQGDLNTASMWIHRAIEINKLNPSCYYLLAVIHQEQGAFDEAAADLKRAIFLDQNFILAHFTLGGISRQLGRPSEAAKNFENALALLSDRPDDEIVPESEGVTVARMAEIISSTDEGESK